MKKIIIFLYIMYASYTSTTKCLFGGHKALIVDQKSTTVDIQPQPQTYTYVNYPYLQGLKKHTLHDVIFWLSMLMLKAEGTLPWFIRITGTILEGIHSLDAYAEEKECKDALSRATARGKRDAYIVRTVISALHLFKLSKPTKDLMQPFFRLT